MKLSHYIGDFARRRGRMPLVGFIGLGVSNLALLCEVGNAPTVLRSSTPIDLNLIPKSVSIVSVHEGKEALVGITEDIILASPSVRRDSPELTAALQRGSVILSDAELFFADNIADVYAVSGSDGKSTTATLIHALLLEKHSDAELLGNIGIPFASYGGGAAVAAELSSFQLSYMRPRVRSAVITSVTPNHLDWHTSMDEYVEAKLALLQRAARRVLSVDTSVLSCAASKIPCNVLYSTRLPLGQMRKSYCAEHYLTLEDGEIRLNGEQVLRADECARREWYNISNLMGAIGATLGECSREHIKSVAKGFSGLEHRLEKFLCAGGVQFINSSIDTTPARMAASLSALDKRVRLILGGRGKRLSLAEYLPIIRKYADRISIYGETAEEYLAELSASGLTPAIECRTHSCLREAIEHAVAEAKAGDTVLLSPAATGYGEFRSYAERGKYFKEYITRKYTDLSNERI